MTGFMAQFAEMPGAVTVVVFGERDCVNAFSRQNASLRFEPRWDVYTAALRESDVVAGAAEARLDECLRAIAAELPSQPVVVLSTCLTQVIGADAAAVCGRVAADTGMTIVAIDTSGLTPRSQAEIDDWFAETVVDRFADGTPPPPETWEFAPVVIVNLFGYFGERRRSGQGDMPPFAYEARDVLKRLHIGLNGFVGLGAPFEEWRRLAFGHLAAIPERALFPRLAAALERKGQRVIELPPPKGIAATDAFFARLAAEAGFDLQPHIEGVEARTAALNVAEAARSRFAGRRLVYGIGSHHNFREDQLAWEGLADLPLLRELGFDVEVVIQERDTPEAHARIRRNLTALGLDVSYRLFYEPAVLAPSIRDGGFEFAYLADFLAEQARQAGVRMVNLGSVPPGYGGVERAVEAIDAAAETVFRERYGRYVEGR
jgi:hypothetical protein